MKLIVERHGEIVKAIKAEYTPTEALIINHAMRRYIDDEEINEDNRTAMEQMLDVKPLFREIVAGSEKQGMTKAYELPNEKMIMADVDEKHHTATVSVYALDDLVEAVNKTGHWEPYDEYWGDKFKCSECGKEQPKILCGERIIGHWSDYCPNCGAKMVDERESEG